MPPRRACPKASVAVPARVCRVPSRGVAPSATTTIEKLRPRSWRRRRCATTCSMSNGRSGTRIASAPPAMPACVAIQPAWRPITSTTITRLCDSAVVCRRSIASVTICTAVWKPNVTSVPPRSLSIVFGTPTIGTPSRCRRRATPSVSSPPIGISASTPRALERAPDRAPRRPGRRRRGSCARCRGSCRRAGGCRRCSAASARSRRPSSTPAQPWRKPTKLCPPSAQAAPHDRADDGVQPGTVPAAGEQPDRAIARHSARSPRDVPRLDSLPGQELVRERRQPGVRVVLEQLVREHPAAERRPRRRVLPAERLAARSPAAPPAASARSRRAAAWVPATGWP